MLWEVTPDAVPVNVRFTKSVIRRGTGEWELRIRERLAFSVLWEVTPDAVPVNVRFTKSVIRRGSGKWE